MSGRSSQRKGAESEKELVMILREAGYPVSRGGSMTFGSIADIEGLPGVHIEVKRVERLNLSEAMKQAGTHSASGMALLPFSIAGAGRRGK